MVHHLEGITSERGRECKPDNVFMPFRNKEEHARMVRFLNVN